MTISTPMPIPFYEGICVMSLREMPPDPKVGHIVCQVWTLTGEESAQLPSAGEREPILENESKQIRCVGAVSMTCCVYNMRTVLIVCSTYWTIYDAGQPLFLCTKQPA